MPATIFVTDDEAAIRSAVIKRLSRRHHQVTGFDSGEGLVAALDRQVPDLILLDLKMSGLSGLETLKAVRHKSPRSPVIMLTAYGTIQNAVDAMRLGAYEFMIKTVGLQGLDEVVDRALEFRTLRQKVDLRELTPLRAASSISSLGYRTRAEESSHMVNLAKKISDEISDEEIDSLIASQALDELLQRERQSREDTDSIWLVVVMMVMVFVILVVFEIQVLISRPKNEHPTESAWYYHALPPFKIFSRDRPGSVLASTTLILKWIP
jgi:FixJ family two-component response regulator